ncbi:MAG TPA: hypothetical protein H9885_08480 [Candidatus Jeotgalicoccus stercoravium]|nr:hypothetical protein [Candidatus Jeotgalicoccus stercoravium]
MTIKAIIDGEPCELLYVEVKNEHTSNKDISSEKPTVVELDFENFQLLDQMVSEAIQKEKIRLTEDKQND